VWKEIVILDDNKEKLKEEAELTSKVESPFLAPLLDNFEEEEEGVFYLVEEFYEDGTLGTLLDELKKSGKQISKEVCNLF
jgi:serine/threonine protein kinase